MSDNKEKISEVPHLKITKKVEVRLNSKDAMRDVLNGVLDALTQPVIEERTELVLKGLDAIEKAEKEYKSIVPDVQTFPADNNGEPSGISHPPTYSKEQKRKKDEAKKRMEDLYKAFDEALEQSPPNYASLKRLVGKSK